MGDVKWEMGDKEVFRIQSSAKASVVVVNISGDSKGGHG